MQTYTCSKCDQKLSINQFHSHPSTKGHYSICKKCRSNDPRRILNDLMSNARKRAVKRGQPCTITRQDILDLNAKQGGLCAYTGIPLNWEIFSGGKQRICPPDRVSLDQINPGFGYVPGNVHLVTDFVNRIKSWYPDEDFIELCRLVVQNTTN